MPTTEIRHRPNHHDVPPKPGLIKRTKDPHLAVSNVRVGLEARLEHVGEEVLPRTVAALEQLLPGERPPDVPVTKSWRFANGDYLFCRSA